MEIQPKNPEFRNNHENFHQFMYNDPFHDHGIKPDDKIVRFKYDP